MFRLGTTSYIVPDDLVANARHLSGKVHDMQLVLFDLDDGQSNFPDLSTVKALAEISRTSGLTYTVHLPLDVRLGPNGEEGHVSLVKARKVIAIVRALEPSAYVLHLDGRELLTSPPVHRSSRLPPHVTTNPIPREFMKLIARPRPTSHFGE
jgi:hypothetical protein